MSSWASPGRWRSSSVRWPSRMATQRLALAIMVAAAAVLPSMTVAAQTQPAAPDYQRYITFHNDFDFPIHPVIQVPADLCDGGDNTSVRRILVNGPGHTGL